MARYEGSAADEAEDARGRKATGTSKKAYEKSARDRREDRAGEKHARHRTKAAPPPLPSSLSARGAPSPSAIGLATPPGGDDANFGGDEDMETGGLGGM